MTYLTAEPMPALPYATPSPRGASPVAAGALVCVAGLALIFFGGCFCIGVLLLTSGGFATGKPPVLTWEQDWLMIALYGVAIACFASGAYVLILGLRKLLAVGH